MNHKEINLSDILIVCLESTKQEGQTIYDFLQPFGSAIKLIILDKETIRPKLFLNKFQKLKREATLIIPVLHPNILAKDYDQDAHRILENIGAFQSESAQNLIPVLVEFNPSVDLESKDLRTPSELFKSYECITWKKSISADKFIQRFKNYLVQKQGYVFPSTEEIKSKISQSRNATMNALQLVLISLIIVGSIALFFEDFSDFGSGKWQIALCVALAKIASIAFLLTLLKYINAYFKSNT